MVAHTYQSRRRRWSVTELKPCPWCHWREDAIAAWNERKESPAIEALRRFAEGFARCPCCEELLTCLDECTYAVDCPNEVETRDAARAALKTGDDPCP